MVTEIKYLNDRGIPNIFEIGIVLTKDFPATKDVAITRIQQRKFH